MARTAERHLVVGRLCKVFHSLLCQVLPAIDTPRGAPLRLHPDCRHEALRANIAKAPTQLRAQVGYSLCLIRLFRFGRTTRSGGAVASKRSRRPHTASSRLRPWRSTSRIGEVVSPETSLLVPVKKRCLFIIRSFQSHPSRNNVCHACSVRAGFQKC